MFEGVMSLIFDAARYAFTGEKVPRRGKGRLWGGFTNFNLNENRDKKYIKVGSLVTKFKSVLLDKLDRAELIELRESKTSNRVDDADKKIGEFLLYIFLTKICDEWIK